jgi:HEAT repeat protein
MPSRLPTPSLPLRGYLNPNDAVKLMVIAGFAVVSLVLTVSFTEGAAASETFNELYAVIPHLYLIPIILLALWYPRRGLQITILLIAAIMLLILYMYARGVIVDPALTMLNSGMDIAIFVALALYAKDRTLVDSFLRNFFEQSDMEGQMKNMESGSSRAKVKFEGAFEDVLKALNSPDDEVREEAVRALGELNDPRAVDPLILMLKDENRYIRREAAKSLGRIGDPRAIPPLINALKDDDRYGRDGAAEGLGDMGEKAVPALVERLFDEDWHVRMGAAVALRIAGDKSAIEPLIQALEDDNRFVRREVTKSLGRIGDKRVVDPLIRALKDPDRSVRIRAAGALAKCQDDRVIEPLIEALNDEDSGVRLRVIRALEETKDPRAIHALNNSLGDTQGIKNGKIAEN